MTSLRPEIFGDINFILSWPGFVGKSCNKLTNAPAGINDRALIDPSNCSHSEKQNAFPAQGTILNSFTNTHKNRKKQTENKTVTPFAFLCVLHAVISPKSPSK